MARPTLRSVRRRPVRALAAAGVLALVATGVTACGDDAPAGDPLGQKEGGGLDSVKITGAYGTAPKVTFDGVLNPDGMETKVLTEGDGAEVEEGDSVAAGLWIGNGYTGEEATSTFSEGGAPQLVTAGNSESIKAINEALVGHKVGSRVVVAADPADAFGEYGQPQLGIGNTDSALFIVDIDAIVPSALEGTPKAAPKGVPNPVGGAKPTKFAWAGVSEPATTAPLKVTTLLQGDGPAGKAGDSVVVNYLGSVYKKSTAFDSSFAKGEPFTAKLGKNTGVIEGWSQGLIGVKAGSRVVLQVPPAQGYGEAGQGDTIPKNATLWFVIDVLAVLPAAK